MNQCMHGLLNGHARVYTRYQQMLWCTLHNANTYHLLSLSKKITTFHLYVFQTSEAFEFGKYGLLFS